MKHGLEFLAGVVKSTHDGADGTFHDLGDLLVGETLDVLEDDDLTVVIGKFVECGLDLGAQFIAGQCIVRTGGGLGSGGGGSVDALGAEDLVVEFTGTLDLAFAGPVADEVVGDSIEPR